LHFAVLLLFAAIGFIPPPRGKGRNFGEIGAN